jgi:hypothetical protein
MVLRRRTNRSDATGAELLRAWSAAAGGAPPGIGGRLRDTAEDVAVAAHDSSRDLKGALSRFGCQAGHDGWPLPEVARWVEVLVRVVRPPRDGVLTFDLGMALASGWADGFLHGARQEDCLDPTTGLGRLSVLQLRLRQVYEHCASLGVDSDLVYALVVVDACLESHPPLERTAARSAVANETKALFSTGETVVIHGERVFVLASRTPQLDDRVAVLGAALQSHALLRHDHVAAWVEHLPTRPELLTRFLADVTS